MREWRLEIVQTCLRQDLDLSLLNLFFCGIVYGPSVDESVVNAFSQALE